MIDYFVIDRLVVAGFMVVKIAVGAGEDDCISV